MEERKGSLNLDRGTIRKWRAFEPEDLGAATSWAKTEVINTISGGDRSVVARLRGLFRHAKTPNEVSVRLRTFDLPQK